MQDLMTRVGKLLVFALITITNTITPKIFNYNYNYSSSTHCNSITNTTIRFSKHCDQFIYIRTLEFCLCQQCGFVLYFYSRPIKAPYLPILVLPSILTSIFSVHNFVCKQLSSMFLCSYHFQQHYGFS